MVGLGYADLVSSLLFGSLGQIAGSSSVIDSGTLRPSLRRVGSLQQREHSAGLHNIFVGQQSALIKQWLEKNATRNLGVNAMQIIPFDKLAMTMGSGSCLSPFGGDLAHSQRPFFMTSLFDSYSGLSSAIHPDISSVEPSSLYSSFFSFVLASVFAALSVTRKRSANRGQEASLKLHIGSMIVCGCFAMETKSHEAGNGMFGHQVGCLGAIILMVGNLLRFVADIAMGDFNANTSGFQSAVKGTGFKAETAPPSPETAPPSPETAPPSPEKTPAGPSSSTTEREDASRSSILSCRARDPQRFYTPLRRHVTYLISSMTRSSRGRFLSAVGRGQSPLGERNLKTPTDVTTSDATLNQRVPATLVSSLPPPPSSPKRPQIITMEYAERELRFEQQLSAYIAEHNLDTSFILPDPTTTTSTTAATSIHKNMSSKPVSSLLPKSSNLVSVLSKVQAAREEGKQRLSESDQEKLQAALSHQSRRQSGGIFSHTKVLTSEDIRRRFEELLADQSREVIKAEVATSQRVRELENWLLSIERDRHRATLLASGSEGQATQLLEGSSASLSALPDMTEQPKLTDVNSRIAEVAPAHGEVPLSSMARSGGYSVEKVAGSIPSEAESQFSSVYLSKLLSKNEDTKKTFASQRKVLGEGQRQLFHMLGRNFLRSTHFRAMCAGAVIFWYEESRLAQWKAFMPALAEARSRTHDAGIFIAEAGGNEITDGLRQGAADPSRSVAKIDATFYFFRTKAASLNEDKVAQ